jgi:glycosyltransferase involved in cell wall biosynthesis
MSEWEKGLVSIVVPTYFSEKYLEQCLDSIVHQTYPNIEVIICDGASTDRTVEIIEQYESRYPYIRCIHKENEGVSASRNCGIHAARGEYLQFVDSDDFLLPNACETMVKALKETGSDLCIAGYHILRTEEKRSPLPGVYEGPGEFAGHLQDYYFYKKNCMNTPWNKLYRRETLRAEFPESLSMGEDLMFNLQVLREAKRIAVISEIVYVYNNLNVESLAYRYRENGFEIETMLHENMLGFQRQFGGDINVLYANYLFGIKTKAEALICRSGLSGRACRRKIGQWMDEKSVRNLAEEYRPDRKKDRIMLRFLKHRHSFLFYLYYKAVQMGGKG